MRFLPTMQLKVELFAGIDVADAAADLCELANRVGTLCVAEFNGVKLWARPGDDSAQLVAAWGEQMKRPAHVYKIAQAPHRPDGSYADCHGFTSEEARIAGSKGGLARKAKHDERKAQ